MSNEVNEAPAPVGIESEGKAPEFRFETLEDLIDYEEEIHIEGEELLEASHAAFMLMSDELKEEIGDKARQLLEVIDPDLSAEIEDGELFVCYKNRTTIGFAVCMGEHGIEGHNHQEVVSVPVAGLLMDAEDWEAFLEIAPWLSETGLMSFTY